MKRLSETLKDPESSGVYLLEQSNLSEDLEKLTRELGLAFFLLDGKDIPDKDQFLKQAALALQFPEYFGSNWDAFADCLTDMSWHEAAGFVILYDCFESLAIHSPREFDTALDIFKDATEFWGSQGKPMFVLLRGKSAQCRKLPRIYL